MKRWGLLGGGLLFVLAGCGDSGNGGEQKQYSIGGAVSGLEAGTLVLQNNNADDLSIDADGNVIFSGLITTGSSYSIAVLSQLNASYVLQACDERGCSPDSAPVFVSGDLTEAVGYLKSQDNGSALDFGSELALSADGKTLAVGANGEASNATGFGGDQQDNSASFAGAVYLY